MILNVTHKAGKDTGIKTWMHRKLQTIKLQYAPLHHAVVLISPENRNKKQEELMLASLSPNFLRDSWIYNGKGRWKWAWERYKHRPTFSQQTKVSWHVLICFLRSGNWILGYQFSSLVFRNIFKEIFGWDTRNNRFHWSADNSHHNENFSCWIKSWVPSYDTDR